MAKPESKTPGAASGAGEVDAQTSAGESAAPLVLDRPILAGTPQSKKAARKAAKAEALAAKQAEKRAAEEAKAEAKARKLAEAAAAREAKRSAKAAKASGKSSGKTNKSSKSQPSTAETAFEPLPVYDRTATRWNGWGWEAHREPLSGNDAAWQWMADLLGMGALLTTPARLLEDIPLRAPRLSDKQLEALGAILGKEHVKTDAYERAYHARGKSYVDLLHLRAGDLGIVPDAVVYPGNALQVLEVLALAADQRFTVVPYGGGSSVVGGVNAEGGDPAKPVLTVDMTRMNRIRTIDETAQTAIVETGIYGPDLERRLQAKGFTLGHFPQSFEFSTLGGWIAARGAGQNSNRYGKAEKWLLSAKLATPKGFWTTECFPASAAGPNLNQIVVGSEGTLGILTEATIKLHKKPQARDYRGYLFKTFEDGVEAARAINQAEIPVAMIRLSDADETYFFRAFSDVGKKKGPLSGLKKGIENVVLSAHGLKHRPCAMLVGLEGDKETVAFAKQATQKLIKARGGFAIGRSPGEKWREGRFHGPYARDPMLDHGLGVDTLETSTRWSNISHLHQAVREALLSAIVETAPKPGARGIVMGHISHSYTDGASLYFTFVFPRDLDNEVTQWLAIKKAASEAIVEHGGTISHHHGVGTDHAPWLVEEKGPVGTGVLRAVKQDLDPTGVLNPGKIFQTQGVGPWKGS